MGIGWIVIAALTGCGARVVTPDAGDAGAVTDGAAATDGTAVR
jgi:hypothetical protein